MSSILGAARPRARGRAALSAALRGSGRERGPVGGGPPLPHATALLAGAAVSVRQAGAAAGGVVAPHPGRSVPAGALQAAAAAGPGRSEAGAAATDPAPGPVGGGGLPGRRPAREAPVRAG
jgi:hypothetical protein